MRPALISAGNFEALHSRMRPFSRMPCFNEAGTDQCRKLRLRSIEGARNFGFLALQ